MFCISQKNIETIKQNTLYATQRITAALLRVCAKLDRSIAQNLTVQAFKGNIFLTRSRSTYAGLLVDGLLLHMLLANLIKESMLISHQMCEIGKDFNYDKTKL
jgi:hypothetical protein